MSVARDVQGPWLDASALQNLPPVRREFDLNRDPTIAAQLRDLDKSEAERRREQTERGSAGLPNGKHDSGMAARDRPEPANRPPPSLRAQVDRESFDARWLAAQRDAAFARIATPSAPAHEPEIAPTLPYRGPTL